MEIDTDFDGWDRTFLYASSLAAEPLVWAYGLLRYRMVAPLDPSKFDLCETETAEIAYRIFIALGAVFTVLYAAVPVISSALTLGVTSKVLRAIGFALQKNNFTHVRGDAPEKETENPTNTTWNLLGIGGGMHYDHGGVKNYGERLDDIIEKILQEDSDTVHLQEIYDMNLAEALIERLRHNYAHFFTHLGPNLIGGLGGEMVITKCPVYRFTSTSFENNYWTLNRTFTVLETKAKADDAVPYARFVGTHLIDGTEEQDKAKRMAQVAQIVSSVAQERFVLPTVLCGDTNIERDDLVEGAYLKQLVTHGYTGREPTRTNRLALQWDPNTPGPIDETIDCLSLFKRNLPDGRALPVSEDFELADVHLVRAFDDTYNTKTALSDHHGITGTLRRKRA